MADQLSAKDWLDQGLRALATNGFTALKAEPLAKAMGVSRGSFYWHFADVGAFHAAILDHWREIAAEQIISDVEAQSPDRNALPTLLRRVFGDRPPVLESAMRSWAAHDASVRAAVQAVDQRRLGYVENLLRASGLPPETARARAQILYWAFLGFALSDTALTRPTQAILLDELLRIAGGAG
jgi:AcrR family transcriptional regulator